MTLAKTSVIMIGPTLMMGIAVPLAIQICRRGAHREGTSVGSVYAVNTVGAILGAFMAGFILLPGVGLHRGVVIVAALNLLAGFLPLIAIARPARRVGWSALFATVATAMVLLAPSDLFRGLFQDANPSADIVYYKEGKVANILVYDFKKLGYKDFHLNAVNEASSRLWHVQLFKMLGLLPTLVHDDPDDALMVAFGAGMSAGACAKNVKSLDVVDLNPDIQGVAAAYSRENLDAIHQPNFKQVVNDGRNALLVSPRQYSLIISDATNPKMFDSWTLYSQEFYQIVKERLKPGGIFCQWALIPLPGDAIKVILNTFRSVFPHMSFWVIHGSTQVLMLGTPERLDIDYNDLKRRLEPLYAGADLAEFGIDTPEKFLSFFALGEDSIKSMLAGFDKVSTDDLPYAQFHIRQDAAGINQCLDLVRYQESIRNYMRKGSTPPEFAGTMQTYEDIARRLNVGFLTHDESKYHEAEVVAADAGINDANVAHMLNYCPEKKRHFQARLATHPADVTAHNWLGNINLLSGQYAAAESEFRTTLRLKPDHAFARMNLAMTEMETGNLDSAVAGLLATARLSPAKRILQSVNVQLGKARIFRKLTYQPESPQLYRELGKTYEDEGQLLDAIHAYRKAAQLSGGDPGTRLELARLYERHELVPQAMQLYAELEAANSGHTALAQKRAQYATLSQYPGQRRHWLNERILPAVEAEHAAKSEEHPPTCDQALILWNDTDPDGAAKPEDLRRAAELYEESFAVNPKDAHAYIDAATIYEALGQFERAAKLWESAGKVRPDLDFIPQEVGRLRAMQALARSAASGLARAELLRRVASYFRVLNEPERAVEYLREAVAIAPNQGEVWLEMAGAAVETGQFNDALAAADKVLAMQPDQPQALAIRAAMQKLVQGQQSRVARLQ